MPWKDFRVHSRLHLDGLDNEKVYAKLAEIDATKKSWHVTDRLLPQTIARISHSVLVTSTGASNRIEGNRLTDAEVEQLYKNLRIRKFATRDEQEIAGYLACLAEIFKHYNDITIGEFSIMKLHQDMLMHSEKDAYHSGRYKVGDNRVEAKDASGKVLGVIFEPTLPYLVPKEMQELIAWYLWAIATKAKHPLLLIANFLFEYLAIHPFQDGNGRTSRLLTNLLLLQQGYLFASVASHERIIEQHKADYYLALNKTQKTWKTTQEDIMPWLSFFLDVVVQQSHKALHLLEHDSREFLLSEKQLTLWQWAAASNGTFSRSDAIAALGFAPRTIEASIKKLVQLKFLQKLGQSKATRYSRLGNAESMSPLGN